MPSPPRDTAFFRRTELANCAGDKIAEPLIIAQS
jgi:hypothetical protein